LLEQAAGGGGAPTYGFSTGDETIRLADGALLHITSSRFADRTDVGYGGWLPADVPVGDPLTAALEQLGSA
jgi:hypothetical protein